MFRFTLGRLSSSVGAGASSTSTYAPIQVVCLEVWEHFKRFGMSECGDAVTVRMQAPPEAIALINNTIYMRNHLELFLVPPQGGAGGHSVHAERGWQIGSFRNARNGSRRVIVEALLSHGWRLEQQNASISERDMIITSMTFTRPTAAATDNASSSVTTK